MLPLFLNILLFTLNFHVGESQRLPFEIGPRNITRIVGETNVYIPCPYPGSSSPIWIINGNHYEAFHLPEKMISVSFGLLITSIDESMDGKTFQCVVPTGVGFKTKKSSIGMLRVEKTSPGRFVGSFLTKPAIPAPIPLDHQRIVFENVDKTLSWKNIVNCSGYQLNSTTCNGTKLRNWDQYIIQATTIILPPISKPFKKLEYFKLTAVDRNTGATCQDFIPEIVIQKKDVTENRQVSFNGFCDIIESVVGLYIVLPNKTGGSDCPCPIIFHNDNAYELTYCFCGGDTIFQDSVLVFKWRLEPVTQYHVCLLNVTKEMNLTILHFFELYRSCADDDGPRRTRPYRNYVHSFRMLIVLPDPPDISVDEISGQVMFSSPPREGIPLDHYQVIIVDVTNQTVVNCMITDNNISVGGLFQQEKCSPYNVTVQAHNSQGFADYSILITANSSNNGDKCSCIADTVGAEIDLVSDIDAPEMNAISVQVNCSHNYSQPVLIHIAVQQKGVTLNNSTISCEHESNNPFDFLKCDTSYDLLVSWISNSGEDTQTDHECTLNKALNRMISCPEKHPGIQLSTQEIIIIAVSGGSVISALIIILSLLAAVIYLSRRVRKIQLVRLDQADQDQADQDEESLTEPT